MAAATAGRLPTTGRPGLSGSVRVRPGSFVSLLGVALCGLLAGGCMEATTSVVADTAPSSTGGRWSGAATQFAHIGETVTFQVALVGLRKGLADYALVECSDGEVLTPLAEPSGFIRFERAFESEAPPARPITVKVRAYRRRGQQDAMEVRGELFRAERVNDVPDELIGKGTVGIVVYQSQVEFAFGPEAQGWDFSSGRLRIRRRDGRTTQVPAAKFSRSGYDILGPDREGTTRITYQPTHEQVNRTGTTEAIFDVYGPEGRLVRRQTEFDTP